MSLAKWWHRVSMRFFKKLLDWVRKDPDVSFREYDECKRKLDEYDRREKK